MVALPPLVGLLPTTHSGVLCEVQGGRVLCDAHVDPVKTLVDNLVSDAIQHAIYGAGQRAEPAAAPVLWCLHEDCIETSTECFPDSAALEKHTRECHHDAKKGLVGDVVFTVVGDEEAQQDKYYITTAINYTNGQPHLGHAYEAITSDVVARYHRLCGRPTYFLTGSDEHGQKIANTAKKKGLEPIDICDLHVGQFKELNKRLLISNDGYIRTTEERHRAVVHDLWERCAAAGDIYLGSYEGWYNEKEERFEKASDAE